MIGTIQQLRHATALLVGCLCSASLALPSYGEPSASPSGSAPARTESELGAKLQLPIREWKNSSGPQKGIVVAVHALMLSAASYDKFARHLAGIGYSVYAPDVRGFGRWRTETGKLGGDGRTNFGATKEDVLRIVTQLRKDNPDTPIVLIGESMGADIVLWVLSDSSAKSVDAAIVVGPGFKFKVHPSAKLVVGAFAGCLQPTKQVSVEHCMGRYLSANGELTRTWKQDESISHNISASELFQARGMNKAALKNLGRIAPDLPIMIMAGTNDQVFSSAAISKRAKKFGSRNVSIKVLPDKGHLLFEAQDVDAHTQSIVDDWLAQQVDRRASLVKAASTSASD